jgi:hypothetical protein
MIREKKVTIIKMMTKINIKIKFQGIKLKNKYSKQKKKYIYIYIYTAIKSLRVKFDIISK